MVYNIKEPVYFCGDLHGGFHWLKPYFERYGMSNCSVVFCGDCGLGFKPVEEWYKWIYGLKLRSFLRKNNIECYFVRGNHDDPAWFDDKTLVNSQFKAVSDYSVLRTKNHNILCIGGAVSLDRSTRIGQMEHSIALYTKYHQGITRKEALSKITRIYWENEMPVFNLKEINNLTFQIDTLCTHTAPTFFPPLTGPDRAWFEIDPELERDCAVERQTLDDVYKCLIDHQHPVKNWYYGHYHYYETAEHDGVTGHLLDMARDGNLCMKELT